MSNVYESDYDYDTSRIETESPIDRRVTESIRQILAQEGFVLGKFIGRGGNSSVYKSQYNGLDVAVKIAATGTDTEVKDKLQENLNFPSTVEYYDNSWINNCMIPEVINTNLEGLHASYMKLAECDLDKTFEYDSMEIAKIIGSVVMAMEALRVRGYCHNDISLGNI